AVRARLAHVQVLGGVAGELDARDAIGDARRGERGRVAVREGLAGIHAVEDVDGAAVGLRAAAVGGAEALDGVVRRARGLADGDVRREVRAAGPGAGARNGGAGRAGVARAPAARAAAGPATAAAAATRGASAAR